MKKHHNTIAIGILTTGLTLAGCSNVLDEVNRQTYTPGYFQTQAGVESGITSLYANLRY